MSHRRPTPGPIRQIAAPRIQLTVTSRAESFICRRCVDRGYAGSEEAFDAPYHFHPEIELLLMESSSGTRYVADSVEPYEPGDLVLIGANIPHVFVRRPETGPAASVVVQFRSDFMGNGFFDRPEMREAQQLLARANHGLHFGAPTVRWIAPLLRRMITLQGARRVALLLELLGRLVQAPARPLATPAFRQKIRQEDFVRLDRVLAYAEAHYHGDITMAAVAKIASLSPTSFSRWFSGATGKPFVQFLTDIRMAHAYHALTETGRSVTEISFDCGFNSVSHFIHRFREIRGMSPREFRHQVAAGSAQFAMADGRVEPARAV
ncbi:MAG TPA: AraC family transcriptional regulator [Lacunisphaera sp.]|nr:AraC family transcriptional regulator [Lacunisphaera sp.]